MKQQTQTVQQEELLMRIGKNIRNHRQAKNWTQLDLAVVTDNHKTQIARIERGEQNLGICTLEKIALALDLDLSNLISDSETETSS